MASSSQQEHERLLPIARPETAPQPPRPAIYWIPSELRTANPEAYEPKVVAIGPYTDKLVTFNTIRSFSVDLEPKAIRPQFKKSEYSKWHIVRMLPFGEDEQQADRSKELIDRCLSEITGNEARVRSCYSEGIGFNNVALLLDGLFILYLILKHLAHDQHPFTVSQLQIIKRALNNDPRLQTIKRDLLLLENQIPFFLITTLCDLIFPGYGLTTEVIAIGSIKVFRSLIPCGDFAGQLASFRVGDEVHHLHHLIYRFVVHCGRFGDLAESAEPSADEQGIVQGIPSVKELEDIVQVNFRLMRSTNKGFWDIKFTPPRFFARATLEIAMLRMDQHSESSFSNWIAFEQCCQPEAARPVTNYASFMDCLIKTPEDMRVLVVKGILVDRMNSGKDASKFFRHMVCSTLTFHSSSYLTETVRQINRLYSSPIQGFQGRVVAAWRANPIACFSLILAILSFSLTIVSLVLSQTLRK